MINIYDNGTCVIGTKKDLEKYIKKNLKSMTDEGDIEINNEILEDIKQLEDSTIIYINYDYPMHYCMDWWEENDKINI